MNWNERNVLMEFYKTYMEYLSKARNKLNEDDQRKLKEPLSFSLSLFEKSALLSILKETISKISVVNHGHGLNSESASIDLPIPAPPMKIRFEEPILEKGTLEPLRKCFEAMSIDKLDTDIELIRCILKICYKDIQEIGCNFAEFISNENQKAYDEYNLIKVYCGNIEEIDALHEELKFSCHKNEVMMAKLDEDLFNLKVKCENKEKTNILEANVVKKWESARQEQVDFVFNHELKLLFQLRDDNEEKAERELIAFNDILLFYKAKCEKLENSIKSWQQHYRIERMQLDEQIKYTQESIEKVKSKFELIRNSYEIREQFITEYYLEQEQLIEILKNEERKCEAAVRIQAWWRGTMVRKQIGPYRPKKKSKKPKTTNKK